MEAAEQEKKTSTTTRPDGAKLSFQVKSRSLNMNSIKAKHKTMNVYPQHFLPFCRKKWNCSELKLERTLPTIQPRKPPKFKGTSNHPLKNRPNKKIHIVTFSLKTAGRWKNPELNYKMRLFLLYYHVEAISWNRVNHFDESLKVTLQTFWAPALLTIDGIVRKRGQ